MAHRPQGLARHVRLALSRHPPTLAITLQDNQVSREVISQILGHSDLATTNTYLDSFASSVIDEAVKVL
jgi:site-specific recombinase XerD